jgi:hypothetical protein
MKQQQNGINNASEWGTNLLRVQEVYHTLRRPVCLCKNFSLLLSPLLQANTENLYHIRPSAVTSTTQQLHYYTTRFEIFSVLLRKA